MISENSAALLIDDEPISRDILSFELHQLGFEIVSAPTGGRGLQLVEQQSFDFILLKTFMSDMTGVEVVRALRRKYCMPELPVIMVGGKSECRHISEALRIGANDFLTTPVDKDIAVLRIRTQLSLKRADQTLAFTRQIARTREVTARPHL